MSEFSSFIRLNSILLHVYTIFYFPVDRHLACLHFLFIVDNVAMNMHMHISKYVLEILLSVLFEVELLDYKIILFLIF